MFRVFILLFNLIAALTIGTIFQSDVNLNIEVPSEVVAGNEFEVRLSIEKGELESFSRLQQNFPAGLKASSYISSNADFSFREKQVRLIWIRMPKEGTFSVAYKIKVDPRVKGSFNIGGKFSYIDQNERKSVSFESQFITILPSPDTDPSLIVDIHEFEDKVIPQISPATSESQMACIRQVPISDPGTNSYVVNLLVNKESKQKFAKIEEKIPAGYKAMNIDARDAIFTFKNNTVKFLWMNLPSEPFFMVSYKLVPIGRSSVSPQLNGKFSYLEGEKTMSVAINQTNQNLASLTQEEINNLWLTLSAQDYTQTTQTESQSVADSYTDQSARASKELKRNLPYLLEPEDGVYYRVQLAAGHRTVDIRRYFRKYDLEKEVRKEYHGGWQKYSVGSFQFYKSARDYRVHVWNTTPIDDAFVSAYNYGKRITVQEALMIANQQWYR